MQAAEHRLRFDFDHWRRLAEDDPEGFEALRRATIDAVIAAAPLRRQQRLRRLQWRVDQTRRRAANPLAACIQISRLMWESVHGPHGLVRALNQLSSRWDGRPRPLPVHQTARILPFPGRSRH